MPCDERAYLSDILAFCNAIETAVRDLSISRQLSLF
jgi:hypothetical protein